MARLLLIAFDANDAAVGAGFAQSLGDPFDILLLSGSGAGDLGAEKVLATGWDDVPPADNIAAGVSERCSGYSRIAAVSSMRSKDLLARVAGVLDAPMVTDALEVMDGGRYKRPMVAGSVIATIRVEGEPVFVTFRPSAFPQAQTGGSSTAETVDVAKVARSERVSATERGGDRPDLSQAKVVVSGGRPLGDSETFERVIGGLADKLGGAVGATRAAVDSGIAPNELQVGQTGKIVAPDLYIAAGISGSTQHMAGIKDSKVIVAINTDPDAPIFQIADFGLVADLFEAVPELTGKV